MLTLHKQRDRRVTKLRALRRTVALEENPAASQWLECRSLHIRVIRPETTAFHPRQQSIILARSTSAPGE
ncbi:hypothetical protein CLAFUW4_13000 [Fulvia fulva]|uniref:Uncharacterized protein n=1 Tax=Passalora fulva TaxID=5499 RepID=A0A9Q8UUY3_PASFU|nr:uncharacterized protein CLAFUR5_12862 [Fulvia fulva]KAK4612138.1 hypothetical protein CLAFUR4_13004 [Fulvia fulva]UJO23350.1 hypothetical protein CLAFUR5_12862 [Fulvia fulva]WPV21127.1 hypothetical protein CLAFUW4_13000 [Fulvia fulva]WPV36376.1 hypothetical protein CLAFUW7_13007 [Fulvia fulva]